MHSFKKPTGVKISSSEDYDEIVQLAIDHGLTINSNTEDRKGTGEYRDLSWDGIEIIVWNIVPSAYSEVSKEEFKAMIRGEQSVDDFKEGDLVVVKCVGRVSTQWWKDGEVVKLGGKYWNGSLKKSLACISEDQPKGDSFSHPNWHYPSKKYSIRHATQEEINNSIWSAKKKITLKQGMGCKIESKEQFDTLIRKAISNDIDISINTIGRYGKQKGWSEYENLCYSDRSRLEGATGKASIDIVPYEQFLQALGGEVSAKQSISNTSKNAKESSNSINSSSSIESDARGSRQDFDVSQLGRRGKGLETSDRGRRASDIKVGEGRRRSGEGLRTGRRPKRSLEFLSEH